MAENGQPLPFRERLRQLMAESGTSFRDLARRTRAVDETGAGLSAGYLGGVARGDDETPSSRALELIAAALEASPADFLEYRLATVRRAFDERDPPRGVGQEQAAENLRYFEAAFGALAPAGPEEAEKLVAEALARAARSRGRGSSTTRGTRAATGKKRAAGGSTRKAAP